MQCNSCHQSSNCWKVNEFCVISFLNLALLKSKTTEQGCREGRIGGATELFWFCEINDEEGGTMNKTHDSDAKIITMDEDNNNDNAHDDNCDQTKTIFQIMHFREPLVSEKTLFYSCTGVQLLMLSGYNIISP